jgi:hypothetical protein
VRQSRGLADRLLKLERLTVMMDGILKDRIEVALRDDALEPHLLTGREELQAVVETFREAQPVLARLVDEPRELGLATGERKTTRLRRDYPKDRPVNLNWLSLQTCTSSLDISRPEICKSSPSSSRGRTTRCKVPHPRGAELKHADPLLVARCELAIVALQANFT